MSAAPDHSTLPNASSVKFISFPYGLSQQDYVSSLVRKCVLVTLNQQNARIIRHPKIELEKNDTKHAKKFLAPYSTCLNLCHSFFDACH